MQLVHGKPYEGMQVPNLPADLDIEEFLSVGVDSPDSLAFLLPQAVHDVIAELANKSLRQAPGTACVSHGMLELALA